jgi:ubiquinone/menaquinone biosynthesis C-methylase UbiE
MPRAVDPFRITSSLPPPVLDVMVERLEQRGRHPSFAKPLSDYLDRMAIDSRRAVLDLGCGTGIAARSIAARPDFAGTVTGIDLSDHLVAAATHLAASEALGDRVRFRTGDSHALDLPAASFDAVVAHTLFSHLNDPARVLAEMRRVLRPGGVIGIFDGDYASLTFELSDEERSRRMDEAIIASLVTNPRILRRLPRLLRQTGFTVAAIMPTIIVEAGAAEYWKAAINAYTGLVPSAGLVSKAAMEEWRDELLAISERGEFFGSCAYYAYVAHHDPRC